MPEETKSNATKKICEGKIAKTSGKYFRGMMQTTVTPAKAQNDAENQQCR
uniref:Uncharacterized protein n=1 Tax=Anguilla anguilla TaxID=7936 RepID=A0A0E9VDY4_ANGAN